MQQLRHPSSVHTPVITRATSIPPPRVAGARIEAAACVSRGVIYRPVIVRTTGVLLNPMRLPKAPSPSLLHVVINPHCGCKALLPCLRRLDKQRAPAPPRRSVTKQQAAVPRLPTSVPGGRVMGKHLRRYFPFPPVARVQCLACAGCFRSIS